MLNIGSDDINKRNYDNVNPEDLAQRIINNAKKCSSFGVSFIATSSILMRKNVSINKTIKKVTRRFPVCVQKIFFILYVMT